MGSDMRKLLLLAPIAAVVCATLVAGAMPASGAPASARQTVGRIVRPVHRDGTPVAGYTVQKQQIPGFHCNEGPSPVAVDDNIRMCGPSATYTVACWKSHNHTVLCLRNPRKKVLVRIRYVGKFRHVRALDKPSPQALALFNGVYCTILVGGAFPAVKGHPRWRADYSCLNGSYVYGRGRDGIVRSSEPWRVHLVRFHKNGTQSIRTRQVRLAFYAGTAI
jgi:hypothetical protein